VPALPAAFRRPVSFTSRRSYVRAMAVGTPASAPGAPLEVVRVPMFSDNYGWILRNAESGEIAAVDPAEPGVIQQALEERCACTGL
jgi:hypothetical protein